MAKSLESMEPAAVMSTKTMTEAQTQPLRNSRRSRVAQSIIRLTVCRMRSVSCSPLHKKTVASVRTANFRLREGADDRDEMTIQTKAGPHELRPFTTS
jgi:hypothetical protein